VALKENRQEKRDTIDIPSTWRARTCLQQVRTSRWCTYVYEFIQRFRGTSRFLSSLTSQYRMHFRSRLGRFAIPFVHDLFHARLSRSTLFSSPSRSCFSFCPAPFIPSPTRSSTECFTRRNDVYPSECIPVCKSRQRERERERERSEILRRTMLWVIDEKRKSYRGCKRSHVVSTFLRSSRTKVILYYRTGRIDLYSLLG